MLTLLGDIKEKIKISEDDIKTIYFILDEEKTGRIDYRSIKELKNVGNISVKLKEFYKSRINKDMVKVLVALCRILSLSSGRSRTIPYRSIRSRMRLC